MAATDAPTCSMLTKAEQPSCRGPDEARDDEVEDPTEVGRVRWRQHEDGEPEAHGAHDEVDPVASERVGPPETLTDEDGRARGEDGAPAGEDVDELGQGGVPYRRSRTTRCTGPDGMTATV